MEKIFKTCKKCGETKEITEFPRKKDSKDGKLLRSTTFNEIRQRFWDGKF